MLKLKKQKQLKVINDRVNMIRRKDERRRTMRITTLYDTSEYGVGVAI